MSPEMTTELLSLAPNAWEDFHTGCVFFPIGDDEDDAPGMGVSDDMSGEHPGTIMFVIYPNLNVGEECVILYIRDADEAVSLAHELIVLQPEGTDWTAWAIHYVTEIHVPVGSRETFGL